MDKTNPNCYEIRILPAYTVVRLNDGELGFKGQDWVRKGYQLVHLQRMANGTTRGREVKENEVVEVVMYPAELAYAYIERERNEEG